MPFKKHFYSYSLVTINLLVCSKNSFKEKYLQGWDET